VVGRPDLFRYVCVCADAVVVTLRGVVERFIAVWALVGLFSSTVDRIGNAAQKNQFCVRDHIEPYVLEGFVRLERPLTREPSLAEPTNVVSGKVKQVYGLAREARPGEVRWRNSLEFQMNCAYVPTDHVAPGLVGTDASLPSCV